MNPKPITSLALGLLLAAGGVHRAAAIPLHYEITGGSITANTSDDGLSIGTSLVSGLSGTSFTLDDGQSSGWFDFFNIWTTESYVNSDDLIEKEITASLLFDQPDTSVGLSGSTYGGTLAWGLVPFGKVDWVSPELVVLGDRVFSVMFSTEYFNPGLLRLSPSLPGVVRAKIVQIASATPSASVPDTGSTWLLFGAGLAAIAWMRRSRRQEATA